MNSLNKVLGIVMVLMLAAFALPSVAVTPDKIFSVTATPSTFPSGQTTTPVTVVFKNESPNGNSAINSLIITAPAGATITKVLSLSSGTSSPAVGVATSVASVSVANVTGVKPNKTFTLTLEISVPANTACHAAAWLGQGFAGNSFTGDAFAPVTPGANTPPASVGCDGQVACGGALDSNATGPGVSDASRGLSNKDGGFCVLVNYDFTNNIPNGNNVRLFWDIQPNATFEYSATWKPELVAADGLPAGTTMVAWQFDGNGDPIKKPGRACLSDSLPQPYGTLTNYTPAVGTTPDRITIGAAGSAIPVPTAYSFVISIGDGSVNERLLVTGSPSAGVYNVLRAQGGTSQANLAGVVNSALVMSNPLPLDSSTPVALQMQICIAEETWASLPPGTAGCPANPNGLACIQIRSRIFDVGDGFVSRDF